MDSLQGSAEPPRGKFPSGFAFGDALYSLAYGQIGLGCLSLWGLFWSQSHGTPLSYVVGALVIIALPCTAGVLLLRGRAEGVTCTRISQLLQLIHVGTGNFQFGFVSGLGVFVGFRGSWLGANFGLGGSCTLAFRGGDHPGTPLAFFINVVPIALLWLLARARPSLSTLARKRAA